MTDNHFSADAAIAMVAGQDMKVFYNAKISDTDKQLIRDALENIFQGLSVVFWINGGSLRDSWNKALDLMREEFFATSRRDILTVFLQNAVFEHRNKWTEKIRNNENHGQTFNMLNLNKHDTENMIDQANFQKLQGYKTIKQIFEKYDSGFKPTPKPQKKPEHVITHERVNEREERVRERIK